jgi:hypothetical protein
MPERATAALVDPGAGKSHALPLFAGYVRHHLRRRRDEWIGPEIREQRLDPRIGKPGVDLPQYRNGLLRELITGPHGSSGVRTPGPGIHGWTARTPGQNRAFLKPHEGDKPLPVS